MSKKQLGILVGLVFFMVTNVWAHIEVNPLFLDFGDVPAGRTRTASVVFTNQSDVLIPSFTTLCYGDLGMFICTSQCSRLEPWGSCRVDVEFRPTDGDNQRHAITVEGRGGGEIESSEVFGFDADPELTRKRNRKYFWSAYVTDLLISPWKVREH